MVGVSCFCHRESVKVSGDSGGKREKLQRWTPEQVPPAAKKRCPASQAGPENPGAGSGSHTEGRAWLKGRRGRREGRG